MSVRRLAEDSVQPAGFAFSADNANWAQRTIEKYPEGRQQSAVIPLLMRAQEQDGWVTKAAIEHVAGMLQMPLIRVLEVATFYTQFQLKPIGTRAHIQVCGTTPCMLRGSDELMRVCKSKIHAEQFHLNASGTLSWEEVECLGACVNAPMIMVFKDTYEDLTPERLEAIIDGFEKGETVPVGPQIDRHLSAPEGGLTSLTSTDDVPADQGGPADGAAPQGAGAGADTSESNAGRPKTSTPETDPTIAGPGKATNANTDPAVEAAASIDPAAGASRPHAGATGGTSEGATGAADKEAGREDSARTSEDGESVRRDGPLRGAEAAAEAAVVPDRSRPGTDTLLATPPTTPPDEIEANRVSSDVLAGPVATDHFEVGDGDKTGHAPGATGSTLETEGPHEAGEKPAGLLAISDGPKDDLKVIRGIGPVIESKLNDLGVFHFRQIAAWTPMNLVWIDNYLNFRGRAIRENWVRQAGLLVARAETK
jgi:NADH-quinone oxidoreductase E subunit